MKSKQTCLKAEDKFTHPHFAEVEIDQEVLKSLPTEVSKIEPKQERPTPYLAFEKKKTPLSTATSNEIFNNSNIETDKTAVKQRSASYHARRTALIEARVRRAISVLASIKEKIIQMRYGLFNGRPPMNFEQIAVDLSLQLTSSQRWVLARKSQIAPADVHFTKEQIEAMHDEALRDMRPKGLHFKLSASQN